MSDDTRNALALREVFHRVVRGFGLLAGDRTPCDQPLATSHAHALMVMLENATLRQVVTQSTLVATLGIDKSNVSRLCKKLAATGHLEERVSRDDARVHVLRLTRKGRKLALEIDAASRDRFARLAGAIPKTHRRAVQRELRVLSDAIETMREK